MNTEGGKLFIGVDDDGQVVGIEKDIESLKGQNKDSFLLKLTEIINNHIGREFSQFINYKIVDIGDKNVCVVSVTKSATPAYTENKTSSERNQFFIRISASSQNLSIREANEYINNHWS